MIEIEGEGFAYSGRYMHGRKCLAFRSLDDLLFAVVESEGKLPVSGWLSEVSSIAAPEYGKADRNMIYYNPRVPPPPE